jgi:hypothetical protein
VWLDDSLLIDGAVTPETVDEPARLQVDVVLFADYLPAGTHEYIYTFRATQPGEYQVIPISASEFYFPEVFGRADGRLFVIGE